jgi:TRAP-type C4-dicarboxylate transport system permease small subunit
MIDILNRLDNILARIEKGVILLVFILLVAMVLFTIVSRNLLHIPTHAFFETAPALVLWLALIGASLAMKARRHIRLEVLIRHLSPPLQRAAGIVVNLFGTVVMGLLLVTAVDFVGNEIAIFGARGWLSLIFPIFFGLAGLRYLMGIVAPPVSDHSPPASSGR